MRVITRLGTAIIVALMLLTAVNAAKASAEYLHVANASDYCWRYNWSAANQTMKGSVGVGIVTAEGVQPWGYTRFGNNSLNVDPIYNTYGGVFAVRYECYITGTDSAMTIRAIAQTTAVYYNGG